MNYVETYLWSSVAFIVYAYVGYPLVLWVLAFTRPRAIRRAPATPSVTLIITAYNEEERIKDKLDNTLKLSYPIHLLDIVVASDCSTDRTDEIVKSYESQGVRLVRASERKGKEAAQWLAVQQAKREILVFSDVATILPDDAILNIVRNFSDPTVGCVSSVDRFIDRDRRISGEGAYVKYEMFLRSLESRVNSLVGLSGSFFAARSSVCKQAWSEDLQSDFNTVLNSMRMGLRGVADTHSVGYYSNIADERKEFDRKVRTVLRGISVFMKSLAFVNPARYPLFAWQLISHKLCRWLVPFGMIGVFAANSVLAMSHPTYRLILAGQLAFYAMALSGIKCKRLSQATVVKLPAFFVMVNASILHAWWRYGVGERLVAWEPSKR